MILQQIQALNHTGISCCKGHPPAGHIIGLRQGINFDAGLLSSWCLEEADWPPPLIANRSIGKIMHHTYVMLLCKLDRLQKELTVSHRSGRIVRIVQKHQLRLSSGFGAYSCIVRQEPVLFRERHHLHHSPGQFNTRPVIRVTGIRHECGIPRIQQALHYLNQPGFPAE
ncbi:hypothetical protein D3C75_869600 [compost metagenome]